MNEKQVEELVLQSLEHEIGGVNVYSKALACAANPKLKQEWQNYLEQTSAKPRPASSLPGRFCIGIKVKPRSCAYAAELVGHTTCVRSRVCDALDWKTR